MARRLPGMSILRQETLKEFVTSLKVPRKIILMVKAGEPVDEFIKLVLPLLSPADILIDGGNSYYLDTERRCKELAQKGILFVGCGVSGGEEGARNGPALMPGGTPEAWPHIQSILQSIAARSSFSVDSPCCEWLGSGGAGHFVKMVHNGIEYGDMQLIGEIYHAMRDWGNCAEVFSNWNKSRLQSFLIEITAEILGTRLSDGSLLLDQIIDVTGQKGTGKWTVSAALELGVPVTVISEAVQARFLSTLKTLRAELQSNKSNASFEVDDLEDALFASKVISYTQGFMLLREASRVYNWNLDLSAVALLWSGGCIIRSAFLKDIQSAFSKSDLKCLIQDDYFKEALSKCEPGWRRTVKAFVDSSIPCSSLSAALSFYDGIRTAHLPANLLQAQRDYFGAHQFELISEPGKARHHDWIGSGGGMTSGVYQA